MIKEIESIGFKASSEAVQKNDDYIEKLFAICLLFTIPLFAHTFLGMTTFAKPFITNYPLSACLHHRTYAF